MGLRSGAVWVVYSVLTEGLTVKLKDDDYVLEDGAGWFETAGYAIRIFTDGDGNVFVDTYLAGDEMGEAVAAQCALPPLNAAA